MIIHKGNDYKNEFCNIDTEEKAYLLGLLYADGNVNTRSNTVSITLHNKDYYILEKLQKTFSFFTLSKNNTRNTSVIRKTNKDLKDTMLKHGVFPLKSTTTKNLLHIPNINEQLLKYFLLGYYDGNGGCTLTLNPKKTQKRVYIYSVSDTLIHEFESLLIKNNIKCKVKTGMTDHFTVIFKLEISTLSYINFYKYLYEDSNLFLIRKKEKFDEILKTNFFIKKQNKTCPKCGNENTVCNGSYRHEKEIKQRYLCKKCSINFY